MSYIANRRFLFWFLLIVLLPIAAYVIWVDSALQQAKHYTTEQDDHSTSTYVSEVHCQQCHLAEFNDWSNSHHQLAMAKPDANTVLGDFNSKMLTKTNFLERLSEGEHQYWINTPADENASQDFLVAYTFGWEPLQQYLVETDQGKLQAFNMAWDVEQDRWFSLYDEQEVTFGHALHWQQPSQTANTQCIECHTTGFELGYDVQSKQFESTWHSPGVGCQSCHGPASLHVRWANKPSEDTHKGFNPLYNLSNSKQQVETCAQCHSRRTPLGTPSPEDSFHNNYLVSLLSANLYEVDGTINDEVFEYGSFIQSKMYQAGVTCSDCHNPHTATLKLDGNATCTQCHNPSGHTVRTGISTKNLVADNYDQPAHHHHQPDSPGAACLSCHMPGKTYMGNDRRHDHSFSTPNPAQAIKLGHSDACLGCHTAEEPQEIIRAFSKWYPDFEVADGGYAIAMNKARNGRSGAAIALLSQLQRDDLPDIKRAALLSEVPPYPSQPLYSQVHDGLQDNSPLVRKAATESATALYEPTMLNKILRHMLADPVRSVRVIAAENLIILANNTGQHLARDDLHEYEQIQQQLLANAETHYNLANFYQATGHHELVEPALKEALARNPTFTPAIIALAQWQDNPGSDQGLTLLQLHTSESPQNAALQHALGLAYIRNQQLDKGIEQLAAAYRLEPENDQYAYVLAVALLETGHRTQALNMLQQQLQKSPANRQLRQILLSNLSDKAAQQELLEQLRNQNPHDPILQGI